MITIKKNSLPFFSFFLSFSNTKSSPRFDSIRKHARITGVRLVLDDVLGDGAVAILAGRPADVDVTTSFLDHVKIPGEIRRLLIGEQKKEKKRKNFLSLNCVSSVVTDHDKLTER